MIQDQVEAVVSNVLSSAIVAGLLYLWYRAVTVRRSARIWGIDAHRPFFGVRTESPTIVVSASATVDGRPMTGIGQVRAIALLTPSISRAYRSFIDDTNLRMSTGCDLTDDRFGGDLVAIGGPKTNDVTRDLLARIGLPDGFGIVSVSEDDTGKEVDRILWEGEDARLRVGAAPEGRRTALGIVVRCQNPVQRRGVLTILAGAAASGSGTYGTEAAASALARDRALRVTRREALHGHPRGIVALVRAEIGTVSGISRLFEAKVLDTRSFDWSGSE